MCVCMHVFVYVTGMKYKLEINGYESKQVCQITKVKERQSSCYDQNNV